jgi:hypothetical protein
MDGGNRKSKAIGGGKVGIGLSTGNEGELLGAECLKRARAEM